MDPMKPFKTYGKNPCVGFRRTQGVIDPKGHWMMYDNATASVLHADSWPSAMLDHIERLEAELALWRDEAAIAQAGPSHAHAKIVAARMQARVAMRLAGDDVRPRADAYGQELQP
jgi:hypothetical protein